MKLFSSSKAQVTIETTALAVLAIIALLVMSTYVVRGINAYFQTSEDTVKESFHETMLQAGAPDIVSPACTENIGECGAHSCEAYERYVSFICPPEYVGGPRQPECRTNWDECCTGMPGECNPEFCEIGQRELYYECGGEDFHYDGENYIFSNPCYDDSDCDPPCCYETGPQHMEEGRTAWCDEVGKQCPVSLLEDQYAPLAWRGYRYVEDHRGGGETGPNGCTGKPCEVICKDPFIPQDGNGNRVDENGRTCDCPPERPTYVPADNKCIRVVPDWVCRYDIDSDLVLAVWFDGSYSGGGRGYLMAVLYSWSNNDVASYNGWPLSESYLTGPVRSGNYCYKKSEKKGEGLVQFDRYAKWYGICRREVEPNPDSHPCDWD